MAVGVSALLTATTGLTAIITTGVAPVAEAAQAPALVPTTLHPPTFNDTAMFGLRDALIKAMAGKSLSSVDTWEVVNILADRFGWPARRATQPRSKEKGVAAHSEGPPQGQITTQVSMYETLAATGATGYFTSVINPTSEGAIINKAVAKGLDVVAIDSPVPTKYANTFVYIGTERYAAGQAAGAAMKKALPNGGDVAIITGSPTALNVLAAHSRF